MPSPFDIHQADESLITRILSGHKGAQGLFWDSLRIPSTSVARAIRTGQISHLVGSKAYKDALFRAANRLRHAHEGISRKAARQMASELGVTFSPREMRDLVERIGRETSRKFLSEIDRSNRANFRRMIKNASRKYRRNPTAAKLSELVGEVRPFLGLSSKMTSAIERRAAKAGLSGSRAAAFRRSSARRSSSTRAKSASRNQISVAMNKTRHEATVYAMDLGLIPRTIKKMWLDQADSKVRPRHHQQTAMGPIPFEEPYPVFGVMYPPAPEFGCRCYQRILFPGQV